MAFVILHKTFFRNTHNLNKQKIILSSVKINVLKTHSYCVLTSKQLYVYWLSHYFKNISTKTTSAFFFKTITSSGVIDFHITGSKSSTNAETKSGMSMKPDEPTGKKGKSFMVFLKMQGRNATQ